MRRGRRRLAVLPRGELPHWISNPLSSRASPVDVDHYGYWLAVRGETKCSGKGLGRTERVGRLFTYQLLLGGTPPVLEPDEMGRGIAGLEINTFLPVRGMSRKRKGKKCKQNPNIWYKQGPSSQPVALVGAGPRFCRCGVWIFGG